MTFFIAKSEASWFQQGHSYCLKKIRVDIDLQCPVESIGMFVGVRVFVNMSLLPQILLIRMEIAKKSCHSNSAASSTVEIRWL